MPRSHARRSPRAVQVGYGDVYPKTYLGRAVMIVGGIVGGLIIVALVTTAMVNALFFDEHELMALRYHKQEKWRRTITHVSAKLIQRKWRLRCLCQHPDKGSTWFRRMERAAYSDVYEAHFKLKRLTAERRQVFPEARAPS